MPIFTFTSPDGATYDVEAPEGATEKQAFDVLLSQHPDLAPAAEAPAPEAPAAPAPSRDQATWPKDAGGAPVDPQSPLGQQILAGDTTGQPTGLISPRVLAAGAIAQPFGGLIQHGAGLAEGVGLAPKGTTANVTQAVQTAEGNIAGKKYADMSKDEKAAMDAAGFVTSLAAPVGIAGKGMEGLFALRTGKAAATVAGRVAQSAKAAGKAAAAGAATGAAGGALVYDPETASAWDANLGLATGATLGSVIPVATMLPPALRNKMTAILREPPTPESSKILNTIRKSALWKNTEKWLTLGQKTGDPRVMIQEARVKNRLAANLENRQLQLAEAKIQQIVEGPQERELSAIASDLSDNLKKARGGRQEERKKLYEAGIDEAEAIAATDPVNLHGVKVTNFTKAVLDLHGIEPGAWQKLYDAAPDKYRPAVQAALENLVKNGGRMGLADMMKVHQSLNTLRRGLGKPGTLVGEAASANRLARDLQVALQQDMDHMESVMGKARELKDQLRLHGRPIPPEAEAAGEGYSAAWQKFKDTRNLYAESLRKERQINAQVLEKTFGMSAGDPSSAFRTMMHAPLTEQVKMRNLMEPADVADLKRWAIQDALDRAIKQSQQGAKNALDPAALIRNLTAGRDIKGQALWSHKELEDLRGGVAYLRMIQSRSTLKDPGVEWQRVAMAIASWSKAFVVGNAYKILVNPNMEKMFFSVKGRETLKTLATTKPGTAKYASAVGWLAAQQDAKLNDVVEDPYGDGQDEATAGSP